MKPGGRVDEQAEPAERALPFEPGHEIVRAAGRARASSRARTRPDGGRTGGRRRPRRARSAPPARPSRRCTGSGCCGRPGRSRSTRTSTLEGCRSACVVGVDLDPALREERGRSSRRRGPRARFLGGLPISDASVAIASDISDSTDLAPPAARAPRRRAGPAAPPGRARHPRRARRGRVFGLARLVSGSARRRDSSSCRVRSALPASPFRHAAAGGDPRRPRDRPAR